MNHYDLEENSRIEMLIEFKVSYGNSLRAVMGILAKFRPDIVAQLSRQKSKIFIMN